MSESEKKRLFIYIITFSLIYSVFYEYINKVYMRNNSIPDQLPSDELYIDYVPSDNEPETPKKDLDFLPTE